MQSPNMHTPSTAHTPSTTAANNNVSSMQTPSTENTPSVIELINNPGYEGYEAATSPGSFPALSGPHGTQQGSCGSADAGCSNWTIPAAVGNLPRPIDGLGSSGVVSSALRINDVPFNGLDFNGPLADGLPPVDGLRFDGLLLNSQPFDGPSTALDAAAPPNLNNPLGFPAPIPTSTPNNHNTTQNQNLGTGERYVCLWGKDMGGCKFTGTFSREQDLDRHQKSLHMDLGRCRCPVIGCERNTGVGFARADKMREHMRKVHGL
ncbi:MAG: hypothetical protein M1836_002091 [Candelina mexicana]|nr:MAG: hypothetical protein M1836_002091 [Candelina mexicana]